MNIYLECKTNKSSKFYELYLQHEKVTVNFGRIGSNGKELNKNFDSPETATKFYKSQLKKKLKKYEITQRKFKKIKFEQLRINFYI